MRVPDASCGNALPPGSAPACCPPLPTTLLVNLACSEEYKGRMGPYSTWPSWGLDATVAKNIQRERERVRQRERERAREVCVEREEGVVQMMLSPEPAFQYLLTVTVYQQDFALYVISFQLAGLQESFSLFLFREPT